MFRTYLVHVGADVSVILAVVVAPPEEQDVPALGQALARRRAQGRPQERHRHLEPRPDLCARRPSSMARDGSIDTHVIHRHTQTLAWMQPRRSIPKAPKHWTISAKKGQTPRTPQFPLRVSWARPPNMDLV